MPASDLQRRVEAHRDLADRVIDQKLALERKVKREFKGTPLNSLSLGADTQQILWNADIVTVEELVRYTERPNWLIRGVGPKRRAEIITACARAPKP